MHKAIFLDRDGVINKAIVKNGKPYPPASLLELEIAEGVLDALKKLKKADYLLIGITNQPDVARGTALRSTVETLNKVLLDILPLDKIYVCFHDDKDQCQCRKPLPGLILEAAKAHNIDLNKSIMIGDRWKDIEAGQRANCKTIWLDFSYQEPSPKQPADFTTDSLSNATNWILTL